MQELFVGTLYGICLALCLVGVITSLVAFGRWIFLRKDIPNWAYLFMLLGIFSSIFISCAIPKMRVSTNTVQRDVHILTKSSWINTLSSSTKDSKEQHYLTIVLYREGTNSAVIQCWEKDVYQSSNLNVFITRDINIHNKFIGTPTYKVVPEGTE